MGRQFRSIIKRIFLILTLAYAGTVDAALIPRLGGQAVFDTDLGITWKADANLAATNTFGVLNIQHDFPNAGSLNWDTAQSYVAAMDAANYLDQPPLQAGWKRIAPEHKRCPRENVAANLHEGCFCGRT
jgi:hypothetical protein